VTKLGVSVEKVVATIEVPSNHQGIFRPDRKKEALLAPARRLTSTPIPMDRHKIVAIIAQSSQISFVIVAIPLAGYVPA
jgi:hypothetical protein